MNIKVFDSDDFDSLRAHQQWLINKERSMTFDEQRDFAQRLGLLLDRAVQMEVAS
jgi:hypothetical protein